jgi:hypothetical protein
VNLADRRVVDLVIRRHGEVLDLRERPEDLLDVLRRFGPVVSGGPVTAGARARRRVRRLAGTVRRRLRVRIRRPAPVPPAATAGVTPTPGEQPSAAEIMREVLTLARSVEDLRHRLGVDR